MMENTLIFERCLFFGPMLYLYYLKLLDLQILILEKVLAKLKTFEILNVLRIKPFIY